MAKLTVAVCKTTPLPAPAAGSHQVPNTMRDALLSTDDASQSRGAAATPEHVQPGHGQPVNKSVEVTPEAVAVGEPLDADHKFRVAPGADPGPGELHVPEELAATAHDLVHNFHAVVSGLAPLVHSGLLSGDQVSTCVEMLCDELKSTVLNTVTTVAPLPQLVRGERTFVRPDASNVERIWLACNARLTEVRMSAVLVAALVDKLVSAPGVVGLDKKVVLGLVHAALGDDRARLALAGRILARERYPLTRVLTMHILMDIERPGSIYRNARLRRAQARRTAAPAAPEDDCDACPVKLIVCVVVAILTFVISGGTHIWIVH